MDNEYGDPNGANVVEYPSYASTFTYNANGALTSLGRGIATIQYNSLNLPRLIQFSNGNQIHYTYASGGIKLMTKHITAKQSIVQPVTNGQIKELKDSEISSKLTTNYIGNVVYEKRETGRLHLSVKNSYKVLYEGGYDEYDKDTRSFISHFQLKDYLGNVRSTINSNTKAYEVTEYHASGTPFRRFNGAMSSDPYKFGGKEFDRMHDLNWYDFHARQYNPLVARFHTIDPMAEKKPWLTPYYYCSNNPIIRIDVDGKEDVITFFHKEKDKVFTKSAQNHNSKVGDSKFSVFAHGNNKGFRFAEGDKGFAKTPAQINKVLSKASSEWKTSMEKGEQITVTFFVCNMATEDKDGNSIAKDFSKAYPNVTVNAANGFSETINLGILGAYEIGVSNDNNDGAIITFKKGEEVERDNSVNYPTLPYMLDSWFGSNKEKDKK